MGGSESVSFLGLNILIIAAVLLLIFVYLVFLIRKRWKANFLHPESSDMKKKK
jgi:hypothetical protein